MISSLVRPELAMMAAKRLTVVLKMESETTIGFERM